MRELRGLVVLGLLGVWGPATAQELPEYTPERQKLVQSLADACFKAEALALDGKGPIRINEKKLRGVLAERRKDLTPELREALLAAWSRVDARFRPLCVVLLEGLGREKEDKRALALAAFLGARGDQSRHRLPEAARGYARAVRLFRQLEDRAWVAGSLNNLGSVLSDQGEYAKALEQYSRALKMSHAIFPKEKYPSGHRLLALSLNNLGFVLQAQGEYAKALEQYSRALKMSQALYPKEKYPSGHPELATSMNNLGGVLHAQGEYGKALEQFSRALKMSQALYPKEKYPSGHSVLATSLNNLGGVLQSQGEYAKALVQHSLALKMNQALYLKEQYPSGHPILATSLNNLGGVLQAQGEYGKALEQFSRALKMREALFPKDQYPNGHPELANSLNSLGMVLQAQGEYAKALEQFSRALKMSQALYPKEQYPSGHPLLATSLNNLGFVLQAQGEYAKALEQYSRALKMDRVLYSKEKYPNGHPDLALSLSNLGVVLQAQGEYGKALEQFSRALKMRQALYPKEKYPNGHPELATSLNNLGMVLQAQGEYGKALEQFSRALKMRQALYPKDQYPNGHPLLALSLSNLGLVLSNRRDYGKALEQFSFTLQMEVGLARELAGASSEATALNHAAAQSLTRDGLLSVSRDADPAAVYALVWQSKASLSRIFERRQLALRAAASDPKTRKAFDKLVDLRRQKAGLILAPTPLAPEEGKRRQQRIRQLERDLEDAEKALLPLLPAVPRAEALSCSIPDDLRKALPKGAVLVDILRYTLFEQDPKVKGKEGEKRTPGYVAFVLSRERVKRVELGEAKDIEDSLAHWRQAISESTPGADASGKYAARLRPVWDKLDAVLPKDTTTVFLSPDGALCRLPWSALPGRKKGSVLLEDHALAVVPHGVFLLDKLTAPKEKDMPARGLLLALGGVAFDDAPAEAKAEALLGVELSRAGVVGAGKATWKALPGAAREVERLRALAGERVKVRTLTGKEAGIEQVRTLLPQARLAHFATHGFFADPSFRSALYLDEKLFAASRFKSGETGERKGAGARSPLVLSGLVLAGANRANTPERGILSADAVVSLPLQKLELAVLSACESGLGDTAGGEGVFGLQRAFHLAGTGNVVASLWKVDDEATAALMTLFYRNLLVEKMPPLEALRRAQLALFFNPALIKGWAAGRGIDPKKIYTGPAVKPPGANPVKVTTERTPARAWAAFSLSGLGR